MKHFGDIMFTDGVKAEQVRQGSRDAYAKMTAQPAPKGLSEREAAFIAARDSFYIASVTETGWPYVQHRGGPPGFLRILGPTQIGFADYRGNRQYVSTGNLKSDDRVALILMGYANRARLKIAGRATVRDADVEPELAKQIETIGAGRVERIFTIDVEAFDWNCQQFITPRYTEDQAQAVIGERIAELERENTLLKEKIAELTHGAD